MFEPCINSAGPQTRIVVRLFLIDGELPMESKVGLLRCDPARCLDLGLECGRTLVSHTLRLGCPEMDCATFSLRHANKVINRLLTDTRDCFIAPRFPLLCLVCTCPFPSVLIALNAFVMSPAR